MSSIPSVPVEERPPCPFLREDLSKPSRLVCASCAVKKTPCFFEPKTECCIKCVETGIACVLKQPLDDFLTALRQEFEVETLEAIVCAASVAAAINRVVHK